MDLCYNTDESALITVTLKVSLLFNTDIIVVTANMTSLSPGRAVEDAIKNIEFIDGYSLKSIQGKILYTPDNTKIYIYNKEGKLIQIFSRRESYDLRTHIFAVEVTSIETSNNNYRVQLGGEERYEDSALG